MEDTKFSKAAQFWAQVEEFERKRKATEPQESTSERLLRAIHGDKVRHRFICEKHGSYSIFVPQGVDPSTYPHKCPICEHEEEKQREAEKALRAKLHRTADFVEAFLREEGVRKNDKRTFAQFVPVTPSQGYAKDLCQKFAQRFLKRLYAKKAGLGIFLSGNFGSGKTHLALAILDVLASLDVPGVLVKTADLVDALNADQSQVSKRIGALGSVSCLVLDDFGASSITDSEQKRLYQIIDARIQAGLPTVFTSNIGRDQVERIFNGRLTSRVVGYTFDIPIEGPDGRMVGHTAADLVGE